MIDTTELPEFIQAIISEYSLQAERVLRDGPRYWVGLVRQGDRELILKAVLNDETWESPSTRKQFRTSDQLRAEIMALRELGKLESELAGGIPRLIASSEGEPTWTLREIIPGADMSATSGSLIFKPEFYGIVRPAQLIDYILSYQRLTPQVQAHLLAAPKTDQTDLVSKMIMGDLDNPQEYLRPFSAAVNSYLRGRVHLHDAHRTAFAHGEVYPPHIIFNEGRITLIDWENASLDNPMKDLTVPWLRAFDNPQWQDDYEQEIWARKWEDESAMRQLWEIEVVRQSASKLNYLFWSQIESDQQKAQAVESLQNNLERILGKGSKSDI